MADEALPEPTTLLKTARIYGLTDPRTGEVRYIGKADDPAKRLKSHIRETHRGYPVHCWIIALAREGLRPGLVILDPAPADWREAERRLIAEARARGDRILNLADGGDQPMVSRETRAANGKRNARAIHDDPLRRAAWKLKQDVGLELRAGRISNETRAKFRFYAWVVPDIFGNWRSIPKRDEVGPQRPDSMIWAEIVERLWVEGSPLYQKVEDALAAYA